MTSFRIAGVAVLAGAFLFTSCSDEGEPSTFRNTGTVNEANLAGGDPTPIAGATVCEVDTNNCVTTDANGQGTLDLPRNVDSAVTFVHDDYLSVITPFNSDLTGDTTTTTLMGTNEIVQVFADILMSPFPTTTGVTTIIANQEGAGADGANAPLAGVTYELVTGSGIPYFVDDTTGTVLPSRMLTETQAPGWGGFIEMPAGTVEVRYGGTATNCTRGFAWEGSAPNQIRMPVRAGFQTQATILCQ